MSVQKDAQNQIIECPYDKSHRLPRKRLQEHLLECRVNQTHLIPEPEFVQHVTYCPDRKLTTQYKYDASKSSYDDKVIGHCGYSSTKRWDIQAKLVNYGLLSSDSSSDEEDGLSEVLKILEQELRPKLTRNDRKRKRFQSVQNSLRPSSGLSINPDITMNNFNIATDNKRPRVINVQRNNTDVQTELDDIPDKQLVSYLDDWKQIENHKFPKLFRLSKTCFERLLEKFGSFKGRYNLQPTVKRSRILLIFLLLAGHEISVKTLSEKINIYRSCCRIYIDSVLEFLVSLKADIVYLPQTLEEKQLIAEAFFNIANLKNVIGCIEKINFYYSAQSGNTVLNSDTTASFPAEIICDAHGRFLANDAEILDSKLAKHCDGNYCFLASLKYSLREWTITPCQNDDQEPATLNADQKLFNEKFLATYKVLPQSILQLQKRFSQLKCIDTNRVMFARRFLIACIVLYNFAIDCNDSWQTDIADECNQPREIDPMSGSVVKSELELFKCPKGLIKRDRMIYESCILEAVDIIEQEIEVE